MGQITVFTGVERRRRWRDDEKMALVEASLVAGASVARIARDADISASLIYKWRRQFRCAAAEHPQGFAAVAVGAPIAASAAPHAVMMVIEVGEAILRVPNSTSSALLTAALRALSR